MNGDRSEDPGSLSDFQDLLYGVDSIVHEPTVDERTRLERQLIGVKVPSREVGSMHGALLMALPPERVAGDTLTSKDGKTFTFRTVRGTKCMGADVETGEILYASVASMQGKTIEECGLPENSLHDGYMDFTSIGGTDVLVITVSVGDCVHYYAVESGTMFDRVLLYGVLSALLFAIVLTLLLVFLLNGNNERAVKELAKLAARNHTQAKRLSTDERDAVKIVANEEPETQGADKKKMGVLKRIRKLKNWHERTPGAAGAPCGSCGRRRPIVCCLDVLSKKSLANESYETLYGFMLHGNWMRGPTSSAVAFQSSRLTI